LCLSFRRSVGQFDGTFLSIVLLFYTFAEALIGAQYLYYASQLSKPLLKHTHMRAVQSGLTSNRAFDKIWALMCIFFTNGMLVVVMVIAKVLMLVEVAKGFRRRCFLKACFALTGSSEFGLRTGLWLRWLQLKMQRTFH